MSNPTKKKNEPKRWLDDPQNVKKIIRGFYWLCGLVIVVDLIFSVVWHKHAIFKQEESLHTLETLPAFYGCLLYTSPSPRDLAVSRMPSSA